MQYRMAADIMLLPNTLIYDHALRCGTGGWWRLPACLPGAWEDGAGAACGPHGMHMPAHFGCWLAAAAWLRADGIAQAALQLGPAAAATLATWPGWLREALDPQRRVLFLDTAHVEEAREAGEGRTGGAGGCLCAVGASAATCRCCPPSCLAPRSAMLTLVPWLLCSGGGCDVQRRRGEAGAAAAASGGGGGGAPAGHGRHLALPLPGGGCARLCLALGPCAARACLLRQARPRPASRGSQKIGSRPALAQPAPPGLCAARPPRRLRCWTGWLVARGWVMWRC